MKLKIKISTILFILLLSASAFAQEDTYIVRFNDSMQLFSLRDGDGIDFAVATQEELQEYIEAGIVDHYEPNYEVFAIETNAEEAESTVPEIVPNWNFNMVNAAFAYNLGAMGNEVKVAVIDSGLHSDNKIKAQILSGYDFVNDIKTDETVRNDDPRGGYHGTVVSSIIARSNTGIGTGIAARAYIMPLKVLDYNEEKETNTGNVADIISAIDYATKADCDVINLSLGIEGEGIGPQNLTMLSEKIKEAIDKGIIVIAAAGNNGSSDYAYPASLDGVISVASVDSNGERSSFSQYNDKVFISAPGGWMKVIVNYAVVDGREVGTPVTTYGTSLAAPHVSALAAIAKCIKPDIDTVQFKTLLQNTSEKTQRDDYLGYGIINCESAIKKLIEGRKIYISPVWITDVNEANYTGKECEAIIYNNTDDEIDFEMIFALYNTDKSLSMVKKGQGKLPGGASGPWKVKYNGGNVKYMVWDSLTNMVPLTPSSFK